MALEKLDPTSYSISVPGRVSFYNVIVSFKLRNNGILLLLFQGLSKMLIVYLDPSKTVLSPPETRRSPGFGVFRMLFRLQGGVRESIRLWRRASSIDGCRFYLRDIDERIVFPDPEVQGIRKAEGRVRVAVLSCKMQLYSDVVGALLDRLVGEWGLRSGEDLF